MPTVAVHITNDITETLRAMETLLTGADGRVYNTGRTLSPDEAVKGFGRGLACRRKERAAQRHFPSGFKQNDRSRRFIEP